MDGRDEPSSRIRIDVMKKPSQTFACEVKFQVVSAWFYVLFRRLSQPEGGVSLAASQYIQSPINLSSPFVVCIMVRALKCGTIVVVYC